jgi:hypothetical protein
MHEHEYIYNKKSLLEQFRLFNRENSFTNFEHALEFFSVFGGLNREINVNKDLISQIEIHILKRYKYIRNDISAITKGSNDAHKILSGIALGDRRTNSAFKRCKVSFDNGIDIVDEQCNLGMLKLEKSAQQFTKLEKDNTISEKLIFTTPFSHFWFAFVSPIFKGIKEGDFTESINSFENKKYELIAFVFEQLCHELLKELYKDSGLKYIGRYWDNTNDIINILAKTKQDEVIAGSIKFTNQKIKTTQLNTLQTTCEDLGIKVDTFVLFSKKGFSSELKSLKSKSLKLYTIKDFKHLI